MDKVEIVAKTVIEKFSKIDGVRACYIFGSFINGTFNSSRSDIDIMLFFDDVIDSTTVIDRVVHAKSQIDFKTDVSIVFMSEFKIRKHIYRETFFLWIVKQSKLIFGDDILTEIKKTEFNYDMLYRRIVDLAQSSRSVLINSKEDSFWVSKYQRWLKIFCLEMLYHLENKYICDFKIASKELISEFPELDYIHLLDNAEIKIADVSLVAERLKSFIEYRYINGNA